MYHAIPISFSKIGHTAYSKINMLVSEEQIHCKLCCKQICFKILRDSLLVWIIIFKPSFCVHMSAPTLYIIDHRNSVTIKYIR